MRRLKNREQFLNEAKLRDVIFQKQAQAIKSTWGEVYLDYEEIEATDNIKQGKWKLSEEDKMLALGAFFNCNMKNVLNLFENFNDEFVNILSQSFSSELIDRSSFGQKEKDRIKFLFKELNIKKPTIDQICNVNLSIFRKLDVNPTISTEMVSKDEDGRPIRDEEGNMIKISKKAGDPVFTKNLVSLTTFIEDFNRCYSDKKVKFEFNTDLNRLIATAQDTFNPEFSVDFEIFKKDVYLSISHNPKDILNMSISKFYSSCQHLYSGGYKTQVLGNVFDPNSVPAFLVFETPIFWGDDKVSENLPLCRMMLRNIESDSNDTSDSIIFFDRCYPDRMKSTFDDIVEKYSGNKDTEKDIRYYVFTPDVPQDSDADIRDPYMDRLGIERKPYIGINTKTLYLNRSFDWSNVKISPKAQIKELVIESPNIPDNFSKLNLNLDWIKFKYMKIQDLSLFGKFKTKSVSFERCKFEDKIFDEIKSICPDLEKLSIISCDFNVKKMVGFDKLQELRLIYTLDSLEELKLILESSKNVKKIALSGDLLRTPEDKSYVNSLKSRGIKIELVGPVI